MVVEQYLLFLPRILVCFIADAIYHADEADSSAIISYRSLFVPGDSVTRFQSPTGLFIYAYVPSIGVPTEALPESSVPTLCPTSHIVSTSAVPAYG